MSEPSTIPTSVTQPHTSKSFVKRHQFLLAAALILAAIFTPILFYYVAYYEPSYNSVNGTTISITSLNRYVGYTTFLNVTFTIDATLSSRGPLDTLVNVPVFQLIAGQDGVVYDVGLLAEPSVLLTRTQSALFHLTFRATDDNAAHALQGTNPTYVYLSYYAFQHAGMYQDAVVKVDAGNWTFTGNTSLGKRS